MRWTELIAALNVPRRRSAKGAAELTSTYSVALSDTDIHNLSMIRRGSCTTATDSELLRALIRCSACDLLGAYDDASITVEPPTVPGGCITVTRHS